MKKFLLFVSACFISMNFLMAQPTIPNNGFEQWTDTITPNSWGTTNLNLGFFSYAPVTQTTDKHTGSYAMKLKTINASLLGLLPGIAVTGNIDLLGGSGITGGVPMTVKPESFSGWFKYNSVNGDTMVIAVIMTKWNGTSRDTIGMAGVMTNQSVTDYTPFNQPIQYDPPTVVPDTFQVICVSSAGYAPQENSTLYVDDLSFVGTLGEKMPLAMFMQKVYPNPSDGLFNLTLGDQSVYTVKVYNMMGQKIYERDNVVHQQLIDLKGYSKGIYYIEVNNGEYRRSHKVTIE
ncbi:MAG: T9SS type A sorting domain-containing protein [Bacteroidales bacterium]|nr:T9SS type A sorting domain-containing protein [Bacteroidales bacterium]